MLADSVFDDPITNLLSTLCILIEILYLLMHREKEKRRSLNYFRFGTFTGRFPSDGSESMAVKGLNTNVRIFPPKINDSRTPHLFMVQCVSALCETALFMLQL